MFRIDVALFLDQQDDNRQHTADQGRHEGIDRDCKALAEPQSRPFNLFKGAGLRFGQGFAITVYAFVPALISSVLAIIILLIKKKGDVDPEHFLAGSLSAYLPDPSPKWLDMLGQSIELFWIWTLILIAIGFASANPKKIKPGSAYGIIFGLWAIWVLCKVGWAAL